jgi:hypothetical protein
LKSKNNYYFDNVTFQFRCHCEAFFPGTDRQDGVPKQSPHRPGDCFAKGARNDKYDIVELRCSRIGKGIRHCRGLGEKLRAKVRDDVKVEKVTFVIACAAPTRQADGTLVEQGPATQAEGLWWEYVTMIDHPGGEATVLVTASDLPGHEASREAEKSVT